MSSGSSAQGACSKDKARGLGQNLAAPARRGGRERGETTPPDSLESRIPPCVEKERGLYLWKEPIVITVTT